MRNRRTIYGWGFLLFAWVVGCATSKQVSPIAAQSPSAPVASREGNADNVDERCEELLAALKANDAPRAAQNFDATLKAALGPDKLAQVWSQLTGQFGNLQSWKIAERSARAGQEVRTYDATFEKGQMRAVISVHSDTHEVSGLWFRPAPTAEPSRSQADFYVEEVTIGASPIRLGATLTAPKNKGQFPAAVLVGGSGPQDRDETLGPNKPFRDLAEALTARGVVVLRYDKRTFAHPELMDPRRPTVEEEVLLDALAAVQFLRQRAEVDPHRVFVIGHSLGALLAPEIAARDGLAAGIVLLAPPGRPLSEVALEQLRYTGAPEAQIAEFQRKSDLLAAGKLAPTETLLGAPAVYWTDLAGRDEIGVAKKLGKPILVLRGERDYQVTATDFRIWQEGLSDVPNVRAKTLSGLNHLFIRGSGKSIPAEYAQPGHVDPALVSEVAAFIIENAVPRAATR